MSFFFPTAAEVLLFIRQKKAQKKKKAHLRCYHFLSFVSLPFTDSLDFLSLFLGTNGPFFHLLQYEQQVQAIQQRNRSSGRPLPE